MKKIKNILYTCLLSAALFSCADDDMPAGSLKVEEGLPVTLTLSCKMLDNIQVTSRAAEGEEGNQTGNDGTAENKKPDDYGLQIFIFNEAGVLTGYKSLTEGEFHYNESDPQEVTIETLTGKSYIYAVANYNSNRYKVTALNGEKPDIDHEQFLKLTFERDNKELDIPEDEAKILMSGRYQDEDENGKRNINDDGSCTIGLNNDGATAVIYNSNNKQDTKPIIYLKRVVSKVTFKIQLSDGLGKDVEFKPLSYEIHNIAKEGNLLGYLPNEISEHNMITSIEADYVYTNYFTAESPNSFIAYIPENLQKVKEDKKCTSWHEREANKYNNEEKTKSFTNAPDNGTYVVIKGAYHDKTEQLLANVEYTIHLGDFGGTNPNYDNFDNERNCEYTYNVTVKNVNEITVEATKTDDNKNQEYPGTEGLVINYKTGKAYTVDSHYEAVIMRIDKDEKNEYKFMVETPWDGMSELVSTEDKDYKTKLASLDVNWLSFALVSDVKKAIGTSYNTQDNIIPNDTYWTAMNNMAYNSGNPKGGNVPFLAYTYTKKDGTDNLKSFEEFLSYLTNANTTWSKDNNNKEYIDVICFIDEYYYSDNQYAIDIAKETETGTKTPSTWDKYTNTTPRSFYLINTVAVSPDGHSTYMEVSHSISQYSIQTFYNPSKAGTIMAYGCEYINNEDPSNSKPDLPDGVENPSITIGNGTNITAYVNWNGRVNTMLDIKSAFTPGNTLWKEILSDIDTKGQQPKLRWAFVDRNRDLNRDGKIDQNEIRWYTPTLSQYCGFWMGEDAIATEARLYNGKLTEAEIKTPYSNLQQTDYRHYYNSTPKNRVFWAEEGFSYGTFKDENTYHGPRYVRCIRNLGKKDSNGVESITDEPTKYYIYKDMIFDFTNMNSKTLRSGAVLNGLLPPHAERQRDSESINNNLLRDRFELAQNREKNGTQDKSFSIQEITQNGWYNNNDWEPFNGTPIYLNYTQDGDKGKNVGAWRIPNQRELCVIVIETVNQLSSATGDTNLSPLGNYGDACATFCTNSRYRQGYYIRESTENKERILSMISSTNENSKIFYIRPVRDIAE